MTNALCVFLEDGLLKQAALSWGSPPSGWAMRQGDSDMAMPQLDSYIEWRTAAMRALAAGESVAFLRHAR